MLRDFLIASFRTAMTALIGTVAAWLAGHQFELSAETQFQIVGACMVVLYVGIAALERKWPKFGWLLGWGKGAGPSFEKGKESTVHVQVSGSVDSLDFPDAKGRGLH